MLVGLSEDQYSESVRGQTAVQKGYDFLVKGTRYQVKANRPSGKPGSKVTIVGKPRNLDWDILIWLHYDPLFVLQECWSMDVEQFAQELWTLKRLSPDHYRRGRRLHP